MSFSKVARYASAIAFASQVAAHGTVTGIVADGVYYEGYHADFQYMANPPVTVGWLIPEDLSNGFIAPDAYATGDIICHLNATNAQTSAPVAAGGTVNLQWTAWPSSHHGPVIDYLANCNGDCATVDKTTLEWFKIDGVGLIDDTTVPGTWASDQLIANNNSWTVNIPSTIASGNYVLRHEIIALHSAGTVDGAQNYPQCVNLQITGSGTDTPTGTLGEALYTETDPGIEINIYTSIATYTVPGPTQYSGATVSATQSGGDTATSIAPVGTTTPAASEATTSASAEAVTTSASSSQAVATSAAKSSSVASSSAAAVTASPIYTNGTISAASPQGTGSSRSVSCKKKSKTSSAAVLPTSAINVAAKASSTATVSSEATATTSVAVATATEGSSGSSSGGSSGGSSSGSTTTSAASSSSSSTSTSDAVSMPSGTTLGNLLEWISSFYTTHKDTTYTGSTTVTRRHARDVVARGIDEEIASYRRY